jgi:hypothetical protein
VYIGEKSVLCFDRTTLPSLQVEAVEDCVICMDKVVDEKKLPCGHVFCAECIEGYFRVIVLQIIIIANLVFL